MKGLGLFASAVVVWLAGYIHGYGVGEREGVDSSPDVDGHLPRPHATAR